MAGENKKVYLASLGCPKNLVDSEHLLRRLRAAGFGITEDPEDADALIVNTCGFIEDAKRESVNEILSLSRMKKGKELLVFGCLAERYRDELKKELPEIDALWGVGVEDEIASYLGGGPKPGTRIPVGLPSTYPYAYLKIAEGCKRRCTFCSIPSIRGPLRSFDPEEICAEAEAYVGLGVKELVVVSQDTASYHWKGHRLPDLLKDISATGGDYRLRVHYLHPSGIDDRLLEIMAEEEKIVKYLDVPLQHSEERILRLMGRGGAPKGLGKLLRRLRRAMPGAAIRTSFIVGFPGETEEEFRALLDFVEETGFEHMGAFIYSKEEGTAAAALKGHLPATVKKRRYEELMKAQAAISLEKNIAFVGRTFRVLVDEVDAGVAIGRLPSQSPDVDGVVIVEPAVGLKKGKFVNVLIKEAYDYDLKGVVVGR